MATVTVEPAVFLFMFTIYLWYPLCTELIYENIPGFNNTECSNNDTACQNSKNAAQEEVSRLQNYISASRHIPAFFSSLVLGPFTDRYGRRPVMVISCIGNCFWTSVLLLNVYLKFSVYYFLIGGIVDGMCGGVSTFLFASFAYIADTSTEEQRTRKIALTESMVYLGGFIASITGGVWAENVGFAAPLFTVLFAYILIVLYVIFRLPEPRKVSSLRTYHFLDHIKRTSNVLFSPTDNQTMLWCTLLIFAIMIMAFAGTNNVFILFLYDQPFNWKKAGIGYFLAFNTLLNGVVTLLALPEFNKFVGDYWTALVGVIAAFLGFIVLGVSSADWMLFIGATIGALGAMSTPTLRSIMSKAVSSNSQGSLFSLISAVEILCVLVSSSVMSKIYEATHDYYHGFCFLIEAGLGFLTIGLLIGHRFVSNRKQLKHDRETLIREDDDVIQLDEAQPPFYLMRALAANDDLTTDNIVMKPQLTLMETPITLPSEDGDDVTLIDDIINTDDVIDNDDNSNVTLVESNSFSSSPCGHATCL